MDIAHKQLQHQEALLATAGDIRELLEKQQVVKDLTQRQKGPKQDVLDTLLQRQQNAELTRKLMHLHPADIAFVLESLTAEAREHLWSLIIMHDRGAVMLELSDDTRKALLVKSTDAELLKMATLMDAEELSVFIDSLSEDRARVILTQLDHTERSQVQATLGFPKDCIGALMDPPMATVNDAMNLSEVLELLRTHREQSESFDQVYVTTGAGQYAGNVPLNKLLFNPPDKPVREIMETDHLTFYTNDPASDAVSAFERYDLISAPVLNIHNKIVGNITINKVMDYIDESRESQQLRQAGFSEMEDIFTPVWKSARNRWLWLALNLVSAFIASRIIGAFESTLHQLIALATLMPIVASVGGNTGNQTLALMIRSMTLDQLTRKNLNILFSKEVQVSLINGFLWGLAVALFAFIFYQNLMLSLIMLAAMVICLLVAAIAGILIPYALDSVGRDPVIGSSVLLTAVTDSMGFFIFLGMASLFLVGN